MPLQRLTTTGRDGLPLTVIKVGETYSSDAVVMRSGDGAEGYRFRCSRCGKRWGPYWAHCVGFIVAATNRHAANCGFPKYGTRAWEEILNGDFR